MRRYQKSVFQIHEAAIVYFDAVWRLGSIRAAARKLNVSSSAVNRQILKFEAALRNAAVRPDRRWLEVDGGGEIFARHASTVLQDFDRAASEIDALAGLRRGHIEIATVEGLCADLLPEVIAKMRARHKGITIGVGIFGIPDIPAAIIDGAVHMGLAFEVPHRVELRQLARGKFSVGAIMRPHHPLANRRRLGLRACADYPLIVAKGNLAMRAQLEPMLTALQATDRVAVEAGSLEIMKQLVMRDQGIAFQTRVALMLGTRVVAMSPARSGLAGELVVDLPTQRDPMAQDFVALKRRLLSMVSADRDSATMFVE